MTVGADAGPGQDPRGSGAFAAATGRGLEDEGGADRRRYRAFQLDLMAPHCGSSVLEVGAGVGELAAEFSGLDRHIVTDVDPAAVTAMARRFADRPEVHARVFDLAAGPLDLDQPVDSIVAVNVLEHIEDDSSALRTLAEMTRPGGTIVLWVPGYPQLYGDFDRAVGHVRRYTPTTLRKAIVAADLTPGTVKPVNLIGGIAWWLTVRRGGVNAPRPALVRAYDRWVVPTTAFLERRMTPPFGQSVLAVARVG
jgi:SAM-dependent methyltransferase